MIKTTIVGFGDSLTFGYGVHKKMTYTERLEAFLPQCYPSVTWYVKNSGVNGDTTREAVERLERDVLQYHPNIVFIWFGANDCALSEDYYRTPYEYEKNLSYLLETIKAHNNHTGLNQCHPISVLITPPPMVDTDFFPFTTTDRLEKYANITKEVAKAHHCPCIDFFTILQEEAGEDFKLFFQEDGVHLSNRGYDCLYDAIFSALTQLLDKNGILKDAVNPI